MAEKKEIKKTVKKERTIVVPGEIVSKESGILPGEGTRKEGKEIIANRFGLLEKSGRLIKIIPLSGVFSPRAGNVIIGEVQDITMRGWIIDTDSSSQGFLSLDECPRYINKNDISSFLEIGDMLAAKIYAVKQKSIELTIRGHGLGKLEGGLIMKINPNKVPRIIGKEGSMINMIKDETECHIVVGQNGIIWIKGKEIENELLAKETIIFIEKNSVVNGLTDKVQEWINQKKKEGKK